jgi:glycerol uptake facilitator-like aquaporin
MSAPRPLRARLLAEGLGTGFLVTAVVGSGIQAERLSPGDTGLQLLESSTATALALAALILCSPPQPRGWGRRSPRPDSSP